MPSQLVLLANFLVALALFAVAARESLVRWLSGRSVTLAALPLLNAVLLTLYVFGEDSYRGNGISRWDAYRSPGGALGPMYVFSVALMAGCTALLIYAGLRNRHRFRVTAFVGGLTALALVTPTILGFTLNQNPWAERAAPRVAGGHHRCRRAPQPPTILRADRGGSCRWSRA